MQNQHLMCKCAIFVRKRIIVHSDIVPASKLHTWEHLDKYYEKPYFDYHQILRCMDLLNDSYDEYPRWTFDRSNTVANRDTSVLYYDCTNFYFECEKEGDNVIDEVTGEVMSGLRKYGVSKEHRPNPIVEMGHCLWIGTGYRFQCVFIPAIKASSSLPYLLRRKSSK